jgi:hypothetical protein
MHASATSAASATVIWSSEKYHASEACDSGVRDSLGCVPCLPECRGGSRKTKGRERGDTSKKTEGASRRTLRAINV